MKKLIMTCLAVLLPLLVFGKAAYSRKSDAIRSAEIIAIVDVSKVEATETKGSGWTYSEVASATLVEVIKGTLPKGMKLYGKENFICAQVRFNPGKHLVFLGRDGDLLVGRNWHLGVLPITGDEVQWFADDKSIKLEPAPLEEVLAEIKAVIENDWPVVVHMSTGGRQSSPRLKFAYWQDGTVLLPDPKNQERMLFGHLGHPHGWRMWQALREATFFSTEREHYVVPDSSYETIMVHLGSESAVRSWHTKLIPGFGGDINKDEEYRSFVEMWKSSVAAIQQATPQDLRPAAEIARDDQFRGYNLADPARTQWLNPRAWKEKAAGND